MSARAITIAVHKTLQQFLNDQDDTLSGIQVDGRPPAIAGQLYYAVWWGKANARRDGTIVSVVDLDHSVNITITAKMGDVPTDRQGKGINEPNKLFDLAEALAAEPMTTSGVIQGNYALMNLANSLIPGTVEYVSINGGIPTKNGFTEPLYLLDYGPVTERNAAWVRAKDASDVYSIDVRFGFARRLQAGIA